MRFLLRNAIRDIKLNRRRASHPGKISRRPMIGGKPLGPGATRPMNLSDFTPVLVAEIEQHQIYGNVQLLKIGRGGGEVDFDELRTQLGWEKATPLSNVEAEDEVSLADLLPEKGIARTALPVTPMPATPEVPNEEEPPATSEETSSAEESSAPAAASEIEEPSEEPGGLANIDDILDPENPPEPVVESHPYTKTELLAPKAYKASDLKTILTDLGGTVGSLKSKADLVDAILLQQAEGND